MANTVREFVIESLATFYDKFKHRFQPKLISGVNIKTINEESIIGSGNIIIGDGGSAVQSDWNESDTNSKAYIQNKPVVPTTYASSQSAAGAADMAVSIPMGVVDATSTATAFTATVDGITELRDGVWCYLWNNKVTSASGFTIDINGLGAKPVYMSTASATRATTQFATNYTWILIYNSTRVSGGCWDLVYTYNTNTTYTLSYYTHHNGGYTLANTLYRYQLVFHLDDDNVSPLNTNNNVTGTNKTILTDLEIDPFAEIYYYCTTETVSKGGNAAFYLYPMHGAVDLRYTFNISESVNALEFPKNVYIKVIPQSNGKVKLSSDFPLVTELPSTNDGFYYIFLGRSFSAYRMSLYPRHPVYYHDGTDIRIVYPGLVQNSNIRIKYDDVYNYPKYRYLETENGEVNLDSEAFTKMLQSALTYSRNTSLDEVDVDLVNSQLRITNQDNEGGIFMDGYDGTLAIQNYSDDTSKTILIGAEKLQFSNDFIPHTSSFNPTITHIIQFPEKSGTFALTSDIPAAVTESTVSGWGFTKSAGTVTSVKVGTTSYNPSSGVVSLPAYPTTLPASDVSSWAKQSTKPSYTASEVGALPDTTVIPTKVSELTNDSGFITSAPVTSVNGNTGAVTINAVPSYSASNNGQILGVVNGALTWITPANIYSGTDTPSNSTGNNGDIYLQS